MITYEKLFALLESQGKNKAWLRKNGFHPNTVDWLIKNRDVRISTINRLCNMLNCRPEDILSFTPDGDDNI